MRISRLALGFLAVLALTCSALVQAQARQEGRLLISSQVLEELRSARDQAIPDRLLERAYGIAVIPDMTKIAFFAGGRRGHGVLVVRDSKGRFSNPVFISLTGGSFGWQWGVQSSDIVLVFTTEKGIRGISGGKLTLGADASVAAGPVGRTASAATDQNFKAEVYSYSRTRGIFAGLALDGTVLSIDDGANSEFYKKSDVAASDIINGAVSTEDPAAQRFLAVIATSTGTVRTASVAGAPPAVQPAIAASAPAPAAPTHPAPAGGGPQTFPLPDPSPGREPN
jgi:lipid-binding SYLF domain-containing protein